MQNNREYEEKYSNLDYICGVDEVGRGPLVGPVVASAVILPKNYYIEGLTDSKKLSKKKRESFFEIINKDALAIGIGVVDNKKIDENNNSDSYVARKHELNPYGMSTEEFNYFRNMDRNNEDYIAPENMDSAYEKYRETRLRGDTVMSEEEFYIKHSNLSPEEKNYRMQELIDRNMRNTGTANSRFSYGASSSVIFPSTTAENYINNMVNYKYKDPDAPLFGHKFSKGYDINSIKDLYKNSDGHGGMYTRWKDNNIGLTIKETLKVDGQEYTLTVDTDKLPTQGEWEQEKINFINTVAKPDSIIESSNTTYSFFNMDLDKAKEAYEKTLL